MGLYHTAQVCLNGHIITDSADKHHELLKPYCPRCGSPTITSCPSCSAPIHGNYDCGVVVIGDEPTADAYCYNCGKPYPWTESAIQNARELIMEEDSLTDSVKNAMVESLPDIISETPKTNLATVRLKKGLSSAGKFTAEAIRQFVIDFGCELSIKLMGL